MSEPFVLVYEIIVVITYANVHSLNVKEQLISGFRSLNFNERLTTSLFSHLHMTIFLGGTITHTLSHTLLLNGYYMHFQYKHLIN